MKDINWPSDIKLVVEEYEKEEDKSCWLRRARFEKEPRTLGSVDQNLSERIDLWIFR